jgi:hypothetical protein
MAKAVVGAYHYKKYMLLQYYVYLRNLRRNMAFKETVAVDFLIEVEELSLIEA